MAAISRANETKLALKAVARLRNINSRKIPVRQMVLAVAVCSVLFFAAATTVCSYTPTAQDVNTITGFVYSESRAPVGQVYVELQNDFYSALRRVRTQNSGLFSFSGLAPGNYYLKVITTGTDYEEETKSVTLQAISRRLANTEQVDFYLRSRRSRDRAQTAPPGVVFVQEVPAEAEALYDSAIKDLAAKNDAAGFEKLKKSLEIFPDYYVALDRLGNEYVARGHYEAAYVLLTKALMANKRSLSSTMGLGLALFRLGQTDLAIGQFKAAVELDPASPNGHIWMGIVLHDKKKYSDALNSLLKANDLTKGEVAEVHWQLARVYKDLNRFDRSADEMELFLKFKPEAKNAEELRQVIESLRKKK